MNVRDALLWFAAGFVCGLSASLILYALTVDMGSVAR